MLGLLLKDFYNTRKQALWYLAMILIFGVLSVVLENIAFAATIGVLVTISMPLSAIAYEEKDRYQQKYQRSPFEFHSPPLSGSIGLFYADLSVLFPAVFCLF